MEEIPASIGKLQHLKVLNIQCGCSERLVPGYRFKPKEEIGIQRIPPELQKLNNLRSLDISQSMIGSKPDFLQKMHGL